MRSASLILAMCVSIQAVAQMKVCMGGDLDHMSASERLACSDQVRMATNASANLKAPADWHVVVVCGEDGWKDYVAFSKRAEGELSMASSSTDMFTRTTFIRGSRMTSPAAVTETMLGSLSTSRDGLELLAAK